jgi:SprA-related family
MSSGSILPSIGPAPPEFRRPPVPENLRPQLASVSAKQASSQNEPAQASQTPAQPRQKGDAEKAGSFIPSQQSQQPPSANLGGPSAVALQVKEGQSETPSNASSGAQGQAELSEEERAAVERLKERDREVRAHENAHASVGRGYTSAPSFEFTRGPDGVQYAVGGQVEIDASPIPNDPGATVTKLEIVRNAALAPARPSGQDRSVAAAASAGAQEASAQLAREKKEEFEATFKDDEADNTGRPTDGPTSNLANGLPSSERAGGAESVFLTGKPIDEIGSGLQADANTSGSAGQFFGGQPGFNLGGAASASAFLTGQAALAPGATASQPPLISINLLV